MFSNIELSEFILNFLPFEFLKEYKKSLPDAFDSNFLTYCGHRDVAYFFKNEEMLNATSKETDDLKLKILISNYFDFIN